MSFSQVSKLAGDSETCKLAREPRARPASRPSIRSPRLSKSTIDRHPTHGARRSERCPSKLDPEPVAQVPGLRSGHPVCSSLPTARRGLGRATVARLARHRKDDSAYPQGVSPMPRLGQRDSADRIARRGAVVNASSGMRAVSGQRAEDQHLALEAGDVARREIDHGDDQPADQHLRIRIGRRQLGRRSLDAARPEVDASSDTLACAPRKRLRGGDSSNAHVELVKVVDRGAARRLEGRCYSSASSCQSVANVMRRYNPARSRLAVALGRRPEGAPAHQEGAFHHQADRLVRAGRPDRTVARKSRGSHDQADVPAQEAASRQGARLPRPDEHARPGGGFSLHAAPRAASS